MNTLERFKKNSPVKWKAIGAALVAASQGIIQYFLSDHTVLRIIGALMFAGYFVTNLTVEANNDKPTQ